MFLVSVIGRPENGRAHVEHSIRLNAVILYMEVQRAIHGVTKRLTWRNVAFIIEDGALRAEPLPA